MAALASAGVTKRAALAATIASLAHLDWIWIAAAIVLESASMAALSSMQRRLLASGGTNVGVRPMLATTFAANALSVSVPLAGPELGTVFTFRRFTRQGADAPLAGWALLVGGVVSSGAGVFIVVGGGLSSGNFPATVAAVAAGLVAAAALAAVATAARRPWIRGSLERLVAWTLRQRSRMLRRPAEDPGRAVQAWADRLGSLRLPASGWMTATRRVCRERSRRARSA
jgi:putative heme transporter